VNIESKYEVCLDERAWLCIS